LQSFSTDLLLDEFFRASLPWSLDFDFLGEFKIDSLHISMLSTPSKLLFSFSAFKKSGMSLLAENLGFFLHGFYDWSAISGKSIFFL
jgi:hypothetical protein